MGRRYRLLSIVVSLLFLYLLFTEVYDRYSNTWTLYQAVREKETTVLDPSFLGHRKEILSAERDSLSSRIQRERSAYLQNEVGVIQCISDNARRNQVTIESLNPGNEHQTGQFQELDFSVCIRGKFTQTGLFTSGLENATIPFDITKIQMVSNPIGEGNLQYISEAKAYLYHAVH